MQVGGNRRRGLGEATEASLPDLLASRGLINDLGTLGEKTSPGAKALDKLLSTLRQTGGRDLLYQTILGLGNAFNGYDSYGHYLRSSVQINNCLDLQIGDPIPGKPSDGCSAKWTGVGASAATAASQLTAAAAANANPTPDQIIDAPGADEADLLDQKNNAGDLGKGSARAAGDLLDYLTGDNTGTADDTGSTDDTQAPDAQTPTITFGSEAGK